MMKCEDEALLREAIRWIGEEIPACTDLLQKKNMANRRCKLLEKVGDAEELKQATAEKEKYDQEFRASRK